MINRRHSPCGCHSSAPVHHPASSLRPFLGSTNQDRRPAHSWARVRLDFLDVSSSRWSGLFADRIFVLELIVVHGQEIANLFTDYWLLTGAYAVEQSRVYNIAEHTDCWITDITHQIALINISGKMMHLHFNYLVTDNYTVPFSYRHTF